ncbi:hypothetical protein [Streptomyces sp. NBC_00474]|uniref:hypothetical protein n=1 Tax=Streptomyces sp. NBC_00474 TaxID=2975754 RepID=UPI0022518AFE|nr:hypothetical protein [Streptomyces sp. NBC_00474]MCX5050280.1 hypothetical protein [Streptomyces sp. NBC_00474]
MRPDDGGGDFRGINPDRLGDLIRAVNSSTGDGGAAAQPHINSWMSHARRLQMDTARLSKMTKHLSWAHDQLPMLRRRHSLAMDEEKQDKEIGLGAGMVSAGAGDMGAYKTQSEAQKAAKEDAKAYKDGDMGLDEYMKKLEANQNDPDYCKAAMDELGDTALYRLQDGPMMFDPDHPEAGTRILATTVATAMRNGTTFKDDQGNEDLQHLSGLLAFADFPTDVVANLGKQCLAPGNYMYGEKVWAAMGNDPAASTKFLHDNMDRIPQWMKDDSDHHGGLPDFQAKAFAGVIRAGTLDGMGADTKLAADNSEKLINYYAKHPDEHTHSDIQKAFGDIITYHWDDVQSILTDPAPADLGADHISVSESDLRSFIDEAMRNPDATATLMAFSKSQANFIVDDNPDNHEAVHASGLLNGVFTYEAMKTYSALNAENADKADEWNASIQTQLTAVTGAGIEIAFAPNEAAATVSKAVVNDVVGLFVADVNLVDKGSELTPPGTTSWQDEWQQAAHMAYVKNPEVGNPGQYADEYCNGKKFLDSGGRLIKGASQQQKIAYNSWLKDQGLANAANPHFIDLDNGRHDGSPVTGG